MMTAIKITPAEKLTQSAIIFFLIVFWLVGTVDDNVARDDLDVFSGCGSENSDGLLVFSFVVIFVVEDSSLSDVSNDGFTVNVEGDSVRLESEDRCCASVGEMDVRTLDAG